MMTTPGRQFTESVLKCRFRTLDGRFVKHITHHLEEDR